MPLTAENGSVLGSKTNQPLFASATRREAAASWSGLMAARSERLIGEDKAVDVAVVACSELSMRNRMSFVPFFNETLPAFAQARNRKSGLPSAAMLADSRPLSTSIGVEGPSLSRYASFARTGLGAHPQRVLAGRRGCEPIGGLARLVVEVANQVAAGELVALDLVVPVRVPVHCRLRWLLTFDPDPRRTRG